MVRVLVVEDDPGIRAALLRSLTSAGHAVSSQPTGMAGLTEAVDERPDVVVLDLGLPDVDGLTVLSMLRAVSQVPVVVATARDDEREIVKALDLGADDYLVKPFGGDQLEARIRAVLRRAGHDAPPAPIVAPAPSKTSVVAAMSMICRDLNEKSTCALASLSKKVTSSRSFIFFCSAKAMTGPWVVP